MTERFELPEELVSKLEENDYQIRQYDNCFEFEFYTSRGQDVIVPVDSEGDLDHLAWNLQNYLNNFDVSYETYLWLDETGHGKNGAPYDMMDVYQDMEEARVLIEELCYFINQYNERRN